MSYPLVNLTNLVQAAHFILSLNYVTSESSNYAIINWQQYYTRLQASFADWLISKSNLRLGTLDVIETVEYCLQTLLDTVNIMVPQLLPKDRYQLALLLAQAKSQTGYHQKNLS